MYTCVYENWRSSKRRNLDGLSKDNIKISYCRRQSCNNGSNISGKTKGAQTKIMEINELARYIPCSAHSL